MNGLVQHVASGGVFFTGVALMLLAAALPLARRPWVRRRAAVVCLLGVVAVAVSSTPLPNWFYALAGCVTVAWLITQRPSVRFDRYRRAAGGLFVLVWIGGACAEAPYHFTPTLDATEHRAVSIFADSVTAGVGDGAIETWPQILVRTRSIEIHDFSQLGATAALALKKARGETIPDGVVLVEIGGNDLLGRTTVEEFATHLDALLGCVSGPGRQVIMFELPLPPFHNEFGRAQRTLAARHNVLLVPKQVFMRVLTTDQATLDSIHLSAGGHQLMADTIWRILEPAFSEELQASDQPDSN